MRDRSASAGVKGEKVLYVEENEQLSVPIL